jgi:hypothetical protein
MRFRFYLAHATVAIWAIKTTRHQISHGKNLAFELRKVICGGSLSFSLSLRGKSEGEIGAKHQNDAANIQGVRILGRSPISATEIQMQVFLEGVNRMETFKMHQAADQQWKFAGFVRK